MKDMGGLRKLMPLTHICFLIACLAIAGIPPFAGFFSKEEILLAAWHSDKLVYGLALITSGLTAFYMFRLYFSIFWNKQTEVHTHHGEGTASMKAPLAMLAVCSIAAGLIPFSSFITSDGTALATHIDVVFSIAPVALAIIGILLAASLYKTVSEKPAKIAHTLGGFYQAAYKKFYTDEVYLFITKRVIFSLIGRPAAWMDKNIVDGFMNLIASVTAKVSYLIRGLQSGRVQNYALYFFGGVAGLAVVFIYLWK
jgi:NADH-quinone oxidoreductase subunit L